MLHSSLARWFVAVVLVIGCAAAFAFAFGEGKRTLLPWVFGGGLGAALGLCLAGVPGPWVDWVLGPKDDEK